MLPLCVNSSDVTARPYYASSCSTITAIQGSCMVALYSLPLCFLFEVYWAKVQSRNPRSFLLIHNVGHVTVEHEYLCKHMVGPCIALTLSLSDVSHLASWS